VHSRPPSHNLSLALSAALLAASAVPIVRAGTAGLSVLGSEGFKVAAADAAKSWTKDLASGYDNPRDAFHTWAKGQLSKDVGKSASSILHSPQQQQQRQTGWFSSLQKDIVHSVDHSVDHAMRFAAPRQSSQRRSSWQHMQEHRASPARSSRHPQVRFFLAASQS
jgi:hypothetical protein